MLIGVGMKLKDKRVDRILSKNDIVGADIFYSPISIWLFVIAILASASYFMVLYLFSNMWSLLLIPSFLVSYLLNAYRNNSFALHKDKFIVVNPNFPFRHIKMFDKNEIKMITIDKENNWLINVFLDLGENYLKINTQSKTYKFYCSGLEMDAFDENWTERTIDDLNIQLQRMGIQTKFNLDD